MIAEAEDLHVIDFPERHVYRQLVAQLLLGIVWMRWRVEWMNIAHQRSPCVREIRDIGVAGVEARGCRVGIAGVAGQYHTICEAQKPDMAPVARVKLLAMDDERLPPGGRVELQAVIANIREALLLVDDEPLDDVQA